MGNVQINVLLKQLKASFNACIDSIGEAVPS